MTAEAERVLEDNGTVKELKAVLRRWSSTWVGVARAMKVLSSGKVSWVGFRGGSRPKGSSPLSEKEGSWFGSGMSGCETTAGLPPEAAANC